MAEGGETEVKVALYVKRYASCGAADLQLCYIPSQTLTLIEGKVGGYVSIRLNCRTEVICRVLPVVNSYIKVGYQIVCFDCVARYSGSDECTREFASDDYVDTDYALNISDISCLDLIHLKRISVIIIFRSVDDVLEYKKNVSHFCCDLKGLLKLYSVSNNCIITCRKNPLAQMLGVVKLHIACDDVTEASVGAITEETEVVIEKVQSEDKLKMMVRSRVPLGGLENVFNYLRQLIMDPWENAEMFKKNGILYPTGVLLVGPPGCGKTSMIRHLCAKEEICLVAASGVDIVGPYQGETESNFRKIGNQAQGLSREGPCILFLDELESLCPKRTADSQVHELQLTAQVLLVLDECNKFPNLFVMGATNRPYDLDPAVRRCGRFEIEILLNVPTVAERASILGVHCQGLLREDHPGLTKIAESTPGFVGADLESLVQNCKDSFQEQYGEISEGNSDDFVNELMHSLKTITPSINKSLSFLTAKPQHSPIGGLDQVKQQLDRIFHLHTKFSHSYEQFRIKPPRGILLYGPRGCGKTRLVGSLASRHSCTFLSANASQLLSPYVGESEKNIAALFHAARLAQPSIIFLDEIDGLVGVRDRSSGGVRVSLLNELLQAMDGADVNSASLQGAALFTNKSTDAKHDGVLICAATNAPHRIDAALLRPGRFDHHVYVPPPDTTARHHILQLKTKKMNLPNGSILDVLAQRTDGYTGAELENLVMEACILALQVGSMDQGTITLTDECLLEALQNTAPSVTEKEIKMYEQFSQYRK